MNAAMIVANEAGASLAKGASSLAKKKKKTIHDVYDIGEILGEGGYAVVYQGTKKGTKDTYAIKDILMSEVDDEDDLRDEIAALKLLAGGRYVVGLYDVFHGVDHTYLVMEEMRGGDLLSRIVEKEVYSEYEARKVCENLFEAVAYCHKRKVAHRDLKPENLLLVNEGDDTTVKLCDFGFARYVPEANCLRSLCGTPAYVAPEVLDDKYEGYDHRADMWSVGCIVYVLLGGYCPFEGSLSELSDQIVGGCYRFHKKYWGHVSEEAKDLITGLLELDPEVRLSAKEALHTEWMLNEEAEDSIFEFPADVLAATRSLHSAASIEAACAKPSLSRSDSSSSLCLDELNLSSKAGWNCKACSSHNADISSRLCSLCGAARDEVESLSGVPEAMGCSYNSSMASSFNFDDSIAQRKGDRWSLW